MASEYVRLGRSGCLWPPSRHGVPGCFAQGCGPADALRIGWKYLLVIFIFREEHNKKNFGEEGWWRITLGGNSAA